MEGAYTGTAYIALLDLLAGGEGTRCYPQGLTHYKVVNRKYD